VVRRVTLRLVDGRLHLESAGSKVARRLVQQQGDDLVGGLPELIRRCLLVPQSRQVVADQRVLDDMQRHEAPSLTLPRKRGRESFATEIVGGSVASPGSAMRPSLSSFLTRAMVDADQLLLGLRGVKRPA